MRALGFRLEREAPARDPAPSRWTYRWQRLMLRPVFSRLVRVGVPVFALSFLVGLWALSPANRAMVADRFADLGEAIAARPEFQVSSLAVEGASPALEAAIRAAADLPLPLSSFDIDLVALRETVAGLSAVDQAAVGLRTGGVLTISVVERVPVAVWRLGEELRLVDAEGAITGMIAERAHRADLPLIAGDGAMDAIGEALELFQAAAPLGPRVRGLMRMGERRWDLILDRDQVLMLPQDGAVQALQRIIALNSAQKLLDRDLSVVDLRNPARPTLRLGQAAINVIRNIADTAAEAGQ